MNVIPASDVLAILLIQSDFNPDATIKQAILNVEKYENNHNRYFGTSESEVRLMFFLLASNIQFCELPDNYDYYEMPEFEKVTIRDWVEPILGFEYYMTGDSDSIWWKEDYAWDFEDRKHIPLDKTDPESPDYIFRRNLVSDDLILESLLLDHKIREFFAHPTNIDQKLIEDFFRENLKMDILTAWSRSNTGPPSNE